MAITTYGKVNETKQFAYKKENNVSLGNYSFCAMRFNSCS